ncbi:MAG TPA: PAS domain S-box protein [Candidatus Binatia bacterium]|nr:PAS domain S-box protein [Candidatus Binatia bacterium]
MTTVAQPETQARARRTPAPLDDEVFRLLVESVSDYAIFMLDPDGIVSTWNAGAARIKGYSAVEVIGRHFSLFYPREAVEARWPEHELEVAARVGRFEDEGWRLRKDGQRFWANVAISAVRDGEGRLRGFAKVTRDLTERKQQEEAVRQSEERFRLLVDGVSDYAICMLDPDGKVVSWHAGARNVQGYAADEIIGRDFTVFYTPEDVAAGRPAAALATARRQGRSEDTSWSVRRDGSRFWGSTILTGLRSPGGELIGFARITRDLAERKRIERLEEEGRQVNEFLAMLCHELRNPLAPIANAVALLQVSRLGEQDSRHAVQVIERQVGHLARLVDDLLDMSRVSRGKITLHRETVPVAEVVARAIEAANPVIQQRRHRLEMVLPERQVSVYGDPTRLVQIVLNLLTNAAKYMPEEGLITLTVEQAAQTVILRVTDRGIGIESELLPHVFDLFVQGRRGLDRSEGGLGIGLTLVKRLTELHGGTVAAQSEGSGKGSSFIVLLPAVAPVSAADSPEAPQAAEELLPGGGLRVLVVDDNVDAADMLASFLNHSGHTAQRAYDAGSALALAESFQPHLFLLDIGLPGTSGYELARQLRDTKHYRDATIVAVTGYGQNQDRLRAHESGFDMLLVKPVDPAALSTLLENTLDKVRAGTPSGRALEGPTPA